MLHKLTVHSLKVLVCVIIIWQMVNLVSGLMGFVELDYVVMLLHLIPKMINVRNF